MKRRDWIILIIVLGLALLCYLTRGLWSGFLEGQKDTARLRISIDGKLHSEVALDGEKLIELLQDNGSRNVVKVFPGGFSMLESNCPNHDCIAQGEVTRENVESRLYYHQIICLPNRVVLEMVNGEETQFLEDKP